uniref:Uncharacterized protein n=1 Tax=Bactrocera latifrons TaxID=174628 RepID=A0A0K8WL68_BACLA
MQVLTFAFILAFIAMVHSYPSYIAYDDYAQVPGYPFSGIWFNEEAPVRHKREPHRHRGGYGGYGGGYGGGFDGYNPYQGYGGYQPYQQNFYPYQQAPIGQASSMAQSSAVASSVGSAGPGGLGSSTAIANANAASTAGSYGYPGLIG